MNPNTNELMRTFDFSQEELNRIREKGFLPVPDHLQAEAEKQLNGNDSVIVTDKKSPLAKWAEQVRKNQGQKP